MIIINIILYIITFLWLFLVAKNMNHTFSFWAFIPYFNFYLILDIAWYWKWLLLIFILLTWLIFVNPIIFWSLGLLLLMFVLFNFWMRTSGSFFNSLLLIFFPFIWFYVIAFKLNKKNKLEEEQKWRKKVNCSWCNKVFLVKKTIVNVKWKCPQCWTIIQIT